MGKGSFNFALVVSKKSGSDGMLVQQDMLVFGTPRCERRGASRREGMWNTLLGDLDHPIGAPPCFTLAAAFCSFWASVSRQSRADLHK